MHPETAGVPARIVVATRCVLEPLVAAHAQEMFGVLSDPAIYEFENQPPVSEEWLASRFRRLESRRSTERGGSWKRPRDSGSV